MSPTAFDGRRAHQPRPTPEDGGPRSDGVSSPGLPDLAGPRIGDGEPDLPAFEGSADANLHRDATATREGYRADPAGNPASIQGRPIRDVLADPRGRPALAGATNRHGPRGLGARGRDQS